MNGEEFYQNFKEALAFLGLDWGDKNEMTVKIEDGKIWFTHGDRSAGFKL